MNTYDGRYLDGDDQRSHVAIVATNDAHALLRAEELLAGSRFVAMEVRQGARLVGRVTIGSPAALIEREGSRDTPEPK
jgi:hypothetical protein